MSGLFAAQADLSLGFFGAAQAQEFVGNILITHRRLDQVNALLLAVTRQRAVCHRGGHQRSAQQLAACQEKFCQNGKHVVAINHVPVFVSEYHTVRVAVKSHPQVGAVFARQAAKNRRVRAQMLRTGLRVDIQSIRGGVQRDHIRAKAPEELGSQVKSRAVGAVQQQGLAAQVQPGLTVLQVL